MHIRIILCAAVLAALLIRTSAPLSARGSRSNLQVALVRQDDVAVHQRPSEKSRVLTVLVQQSQVEVIGAKGSWAHVKIWDSVEGWLQSARLFYGGPWQSVSTYHAPEIRRQVRAHGPQVMHARGLAMAQVALASNPGGSNTARIAPNATFQVSAWQQDEAGKIWYRVGKSWALGDDIRFTSGDPGSTQIRGRPIWSTMVGKGMWLTLGTFATGDADTLATAAQRDGITHLYLEAAISPLGFHGRKSVGAMIDAAHRRHIAAIAWVYPYLYDLASDVDLTRQVAQFRSTTGQRFDGIAEDLEQNVQLWNVRAYSQLVRMYLGPHYLLVGVSYPPQSFPSYPFAELARSYNVIAPMDYWRQTQTDRGLDYGRARYDFGYASRYAGDSVATIRRVSGHVPVSPIGQTFDNFGRLEMGPYAPGTDEIRGFLAGSKASGAIGASFFQWMTATDAEWHAIRDFRY